MRRALAAPVVFLLAAAFAWSAWAGDIPVLVSLTPKPPRKMPEGISVEGSAYHLRTDALDVQVEPLLLSQVGDWYTSKGLKNPFYDFPQAMNYILVRVRFENLSKDETLEFVPTASMFESCLAKDESKVYETFYAMSGGEERLAVLGKSLYLKPLMLPPGQWIERLLFFEYDELFAVKRMILSFTGVAMGRAHIDMQFPFRATYTKRAKEKK